MYRKELDLSYFHDSDDKLCDIITLADQFDKSPIKCIMNEAAEIIGIYIKDTAGKDGNPGLTKQES